MATSRPSDSKGGKVTKSQKIFLLLAFLVFVMLAFFAGIDSDAQTLPNAPNPQHVVEHDPGAWAFTTGTVAVVGGIYRPWVGFAAGAAVGVFSNLQNSNNARQNMVGAVAGSAAGYVIIKTLKHDWHHKGGRN